ncbi:MAG: CCA tRNA nucleotidyltransferase [Desulfurococcaceae archaeon]
MAINTVNYDDIERFVLNKIKPSKSEYEILFNAFEKIRKILEQVMIERGVKAEITLQGSIAHDTWLAGDRDLDVFVLYPGEWSVEKVRSLGFEIILEAAKRIGKYELRYAEHPYVRVIVNGVEADIVPGLLVSKPSEIKTSVDRTRFHTEYINSVLTPDMKDQVRLLKKFMKTIGVYGAEIKTRGFSGYAVELLIAVYRNFRNTILEASKWKPPVFVNTLGDDVDRNKVFRLLTKKYPDSAIYMPDPVDPERNVTANVSAKSLATFILASRCYLRNPSIGFFTEEETIDVFDVNTLFKALENRCIIILEYNLDEKLPPDVIWGEAFRVKDRLCKLLRTLNIEIIDADAWTNDSSTVIIAVEFPECELPPYKTYEGPYTWLEENRVWSFVKKHIDRGIGPWIGENGSLRAISRRERDIITVLRTRLSEYSISPHLRKTMPSILRLDEDVAKKLLGEGAGKWLLNYVMKTPKWMEMCVS